MRDDVKPLYGPNGPHAELYAPIEISFDRHSKQPRLDVVCMADVTPKPIEWLWKFWIAIGKVSVLAGDGGKGKSTVLCDLAARTTTGGRWPDGVEGSKPGGVLILAAEDDCEDTLAPRLIAAGADMRCVFNIRSVVTGDEQGRRSFSLQADLAALEREIEKRGDIRMVIIDPVTSYLGKIDSHKNAEVRSVLEPLGEMAARLRVAVICNNHFSKGAGNANSRIIGSVAFVNQARAAFIVTPDAEDEERLLLMPAKVNITPLRHGLAYRIGGTHIPDGNGGEIFTSQILWESAPVEMTADEALAAHSEDGEAKTAKQEATEFLRETLGYGAMARPELMKMGRQAGHSPKSLRSAREALGVVVKREGFGPGAVYLWSIPGSMRAQDPHECPRSGVGKHGLGGHAWGDASGPEPGGEAPDDPSDPFYIPPDCRRTNGGAA